MDPQALAEALVREILANDEAGANDKFTALASWTRGGGFMPDMGEAVRKVWRERQERAERSRDPFGTASIGSES
jgi:hypothetical protein